MDPQITRLHLSGVFGRRAPPDPSLYADLSIAFPGRIADEVFVPPHNPRLKRFDVIQQFAQFGDVGVALVVEMTNQSDGSPFDISQASELTLKILYPDGTASDFVADLYTDGVDGKLVYVTEADDLGQSGVCGLQGKAVINGAQISSEITQFQVNANVDNN